ncbi:hypothetical protein F5X98DRAFT_375837 [Xylaria grammica]|nr:hypothetical protein F5X98DRAFT_375837 [Xylaria grammica]
MSVPLRQLLTTRPVQTAHFYSLPGSNSPTLTKKNWVSDYMEIPPASLEIFPPDSQGLLRFLGPEGEMDDLLLSKTVHPINQVQEDLQSEGDSVRVFNAYMGHPVQLAFQRFLTLRSEVGPPGRTPYKETADFSWIYGDQYGRVGCNLTEIAYG